MDQSNNLIFCFWGCVVISDLYSFQDIVFLILAGNVAPIVNVTSARLSPPTLTVLYISDITQFFDHDKFSSISQLSNRKERDLQKLLKYFNAKTISSYNLLLWSGVPIGWFFLFVFFSFSCLMFKSITRRCLVAIYPIIISSIIFTSIIIHFITLTVPQIS